MKQKMRRFNLTVPEELYDEWVRYYGAFGLRQIILRRVISVLVNRARIKHGGTKEKPILWKTDYENMTLAEIVEHLASDITEHGDL